MITFIDYDKYKPDTQIVLKADKANVPVVLRANASNLAKALLENNSNIIATELVASDFESDAKLLFDILPEKLTKPVIYKLDITNTPPATINYTLLQDYIAKMPKSVRLVFKCPSEYADLGTVLTISQAYGNIHFCGGKFMAHPIGRFGCITQRDVNLYLDNQAPVIYTGCCLSELLIDSSSPLLDYISKAEITNTKPKTKSKNATTLFSLSKTGLGAF